MAVKIVRAVTYDVRFPTSRSGAGSDAMNPDPDYSAAYVALETDDPGGLAGHGLTFTIGRGTEVCVAAIEALAPHVVGKTVDGLVADLGTAPDGESEALAHETTGIVRLQGDIRRGVVRVGIHRIRPVAAARGWKAHVIGDRPHDPHRHQGCF